MNTEKNRPHPLRVMHAVFINNDLTSVLGALNGKDLRVFGKHVRDGTLMTCLAPIVRTDDPLPEIEAAHGDMHEVLSKLSAKNFDVFASWVRQLPRDAAGVPECDC